MTRFVTTAGTSAAALLIVARAGSLGEAEVTIAQALATAAADLALRTKPIGSRENRVLVAESLAEEVEAALAGELPFSISMADVDLVAFADCLKQFSLGLRDAGLSHAINAMSRLDAESAVLLAQAVLVKDRASLSNAASIVAQLPDAMHLAVNGMDIPEEAVVALERLAGSIVTRAGIVEMVWDLSVMDDQAFTRAIRGIIGRTDEGGAVSDLEAA